MKLSRFALLAALFLALTMLVGVPVSSAATTNLTNCRNAGAPVLSDPNSNSYIYGYLAPNQIFQWDGISYSRPGEVWLRGHALGNVNADGWSNANYYHC